MFATHSYYVHGSWHELRTFHVRGGPDGMELELDYGELAPPASYETAHVSACGDTRLRKGDAGRGARRRRRSVKLIDSLGLGPHGTEARVRRVHRAGRH